MVFSTPVFLFYFLVLTLLVYYLVPRKFRNLVLLCSSLWFYYWGRAGLCGHHVAVHRHRLHPRYAGGALQGQGQAEVRQAGGGLLYVLQSGPAVLLQVLDFLASSFQAMGLSFMPVLGIHLPIGILPSTPSRP